ncbi:hypothetical protein HS088_TW11G00407 [Tripterygium wilfordii]|uniref:Cation efflux protein transmembrane domain-containing protein n=1 Tax=Tripterygium wilfordii TaxID=458696 RepID=A0A7J7D1Y6_TRIWF|nr:uncharacterized protein LOC120009397 [Tripterygium wilfordii]KAF5740340.1 hypothetical protein HS088_TW11G00407 [Tripterygium wilfordii]
MADHRHHHHHHQQHRPNRISVPPRATNPTTLSRQYPLYPYPSSTPTPTPSKNRFTALPSFAASKSSKSSLSFLFLLLFSLRSLYSLLPFLRSAPSFSLFPFSFLVSLLSFFLSLFFSGFLFSSPNTRFLSHKQNQPSLGLSSITQSQHRLLISKSLLVAVVFLLRFQALRYCGTAAMILAEFSGNAAARFLTDGRSGSDRNSKNRFGKLGGFLALFAGLFLLSISWDRINCFPFSSSVVDRWGFSVFPREECVRVWPMLLPFLSGFLGCYERTSVNWGTIRQLGGKRVRLITLFYTTVLLFIPAVLSVFIFEDDGDVVSIWNLGWPLANTVVFGVLMTENFSDDKLASSKDFRREFFVTFICTIVLELIYFPELSLWGLLLCGLLLCYAVRELDPMYLNYVELGMESSESFATSIMKPIRHILSERKSRKIALFLLINTGYMIVEFAAGFMSNSLGLISDACHMLFDCAALAIGLYASYISRLPANNQFNYGRGRFEVLSGYANAVFLVLVGVLIVLESLERILDPQEVSTNSLLTVSIGGLFVNVVGLIFFHEEHHHAHGGSCSHSHSHSHSHSDSCASSHPHHHPQHSHDEGRSIEHHECINVSPECHEKSCSGHDHHHGQHQHVSKRDTKCQSHHDHDHDHGHHHHGHHRHADHSEQVQHRHELHDHSCDHVQHENHNHANHSVDGSSQSSKGLSLTFHEMGNSFGEGEDSQTNGHHGNSKCCSSLENSGFQQKRLPSDRKKLQKHEHHHIDHNMEGIFLHVLADTMGSVGVVISTLLIKYKGWVVADPACSIFISVLIVSSVIPLLRNSAEILLQRVPRAHEQDLKEALNEVMEIKGVCGIQNVHVWSFTNTDVVGTVHLHVLEDTDKSSVKTQVSHILHDAGIKDLTLQVECVKQ